MCMVIQVMILVLVVVICRTVRSSTVVDVVVDWQCGAREMFTVIAGVAAWGEHVLGKVMRRGSRGECTFYCLVGAVVGDGGHVITG